MEENCVRTANARWSKVIPCKRPFSNFEFIDKKFGGCGPLRRILSQVRVLGGQSITVEVLDHRPKDLYEEDEDIKRRCPRYNPQRCKAFRLGFFSIPIKSSNKLEKVSAKDFLGYAIVKHYKMPATKGVTKKVDKFRIYESVLKFGRHDNNYIKRSPKWACNIKGKKFLIDGYLYAQQNGVSNCCADVALRTAAGSFLHADVSYRQLHEWVNEFRKLCKKRRRILGTPLTNAEICYVLEKMGAKCFVGDYSEERKKKEPAVPYQKYIYGSIESGYPAIIFFGFDDNVANRKRKRAYHVIPVFGHTFNEDTWVPGANIFYFPFKKRTKILSSDNWVSMFIGHDDNAGSNYCIPQSYIESTRLCPKERVATECPLQKAFVSYAIGTIPKRIEMSPIEAEMIAADLLPPVLKDAPKSYNPWHARLKGYMKDQRLVIRPLLITGSQYQTHLKDIRGWNNQKLSGNVIDILDIFAKDDFWMVELSIPELFSANRRKIGELLIWANRKPGTARNFESFCLARIPGCFAFFTGIQRRKPTFIYWPIKIKDHVKLYGCKE